MNVNHYIPFVVQDMTFRLMFRDRETGSDIIRWYFEVLDNDGEWATIENPFYAEDKPEDLVFFGKKALQA